MPFRLHSIAKKKVRHICCSSLTLLKLLHSSFVCRPLFHSEGEEQQKRVIICLSVEASILRRCLFMDARLR